MNKKGGMQENVSTGEIKCLSKIFLNPLVIICFIPSGDIVTTTLCQKVTIHSWETATTKDAIMVRKVAIIVIHTSYSPSNVSLLTWGGSNNLAASRDVLEQVWFMPFYILDLTA